MRLSPVQSVSRLEEPAPVPFGRRNSRVIKHPDDELPERLKNGKKMVPKFPIRGEKKNQSAHGSKSQPTAEHKQTKRLLPVAPAYPVRSLRSLSIQKKVCSPWTNFYPEARSSAMDGRLVRAKFPFKASNNDELSFLKGDTITITQAIDGGWWEGTLNGKTGWFPSNYVIELKTDDTLAMSISGSVPTVDLPVKEQHHQLVVKHIVESEEEYVNELQTLIKQYLRTLPSSNVITSKECETLSGNLSSVVSHQQRFLQSLSDCQSLPVAQQRIGGIFLSNAPQIKTLYTEYAANHPSSISLLTQYRDQLSSYMESQGATAPGAQALTSYLSSPFRRLDKYPVLLKELERHIDDAHSDRGDTQRAIAIYRDIHTACVEQRKDREMELDVLSADIQNWEGEDVVSLGDVELSAKVKVYTDSSSTTATAGSSSDDRVILMFPTCILMISVTPLITYHYQGKLMLGGLDARKLEDTDTYTNALKFSGNMIEELIVSFNSTSKQQNWFDHISNKPVHDTESESLPAAGDSNKAKHVMSSTMPPQVTSKASVKTISHSAKTAQVIDSYDRLGLAGAKMWSMSCLRPLPPSRPQFVARDDTKSPKLQRKASTLGRRKNNDDTRVLQEDAKILKVIESYCTSVRARHTVNSSIIDSPNMLIAEDEKIICEVTKDNQTIIEEKSLVDTVYVIKDQIKDLQQEQVTHKDFDRLKRELEEERKARKKLESVVHKNLHQTISSTGISTTGIPTMSSTGIPTMSSLNHNNHNNDNSS